MQGSFKILASMALFLNRVGDSTFQIYRVFYDRLVDDDDRKWLHEFVTKVTKEKLNENYTELFKRLLSDPSNTKVSEDDMRSLMFCDFQVRKNTKPFSFSLSKDIAVLHEIF